MKLILKNLHSLPRAATSTDPPPPSYSPVNATCTHEEGEIVEDMCSTSTDHQLLCHTTSCGSRKRPPLPQLSDPNRTRIRDLRPLPRKKPFSKLAGIQDHVSSSLISSFHQAEASTEAKECQISHAAKSQLGQADTSPATQPTSEVELKTEDIAPDSVKANFGGGPPSHAAGIQKTSVNPSIKEEPCTSNDTRCDHKTKKIADLSNQPTCSIDVNFLQQVVVAFEEKANHEESTRLAKESITMDPSLEPTFLAIVKKHGHITEDCPLESGYMLTSVLEAICKVVQDLQKKHLTEFDCNLLKSYYSVVRDAEKMKVNVNWLRTRLDEINDAVNCIVETKELYDEMNRLSKQIENEKKDLESMKAELEKLKSEIERKENLLELDILLTEDMIGSLINDRALKIQQFQNMPLMEAFQ